MGSYRANDAAVETVELLSSSSSDSETSASVKSRAPERSRSNGNAANESEESTSNVWDLERPAKRRRGAQEKYRMQDSNSGEDEDDGDKVEEEEADEDATEDYVDPVETPSDEEEEQLVEEQLNRRRSRRKSKPLHSFVDTSDDEYMISSDEQRKKPIARSRPKKKSAAKSKARSKRKRRGSSSDSSDESSGDAEGESTKVKAEFSGFVIDKILGREVHTLKEWKKMCWNKSTRFLTHCSIFSSDEEGEMDQEVKLEQVQEEQKKTKGGEQSTVASNEIDLTRKASVEDVEDADEERFLIKWKSLSYLHTSWQTEDELRETDKNAKGKIQRFREKEHRAGFSEDTQGDEYFNPEFRIVDRILEIRDQPLDGFAVASSTRGKGTLMYFLVKWKALPYDELTWEREDDVGDDAAVELYNDRIMRAAKRFQKVALAKHTPQSKRKNFRGYTTESPPPCKKEQNFQLRDYQLTGVNWMLFNWYQKRNSMLADEMGLGKTVQTVMFVNHLAAVERTPRPFIIVAPLSTLGHWQREFDSWTNLNAVVYHGSVAAREALQNYEFFLTEDELQRAEELFAKDPSKGNWKRLSLRPKRNCYRFDVLITTFEMASAIDLYKLAQIKWQLMVVDEAHRLKNRNSKLSVILRTRFTYENMLLLTGTPLQNNVEELWVLLNFLDTKKFESKEAFLERFGELTDSAQVERLHSELKPYLLRRMKEDVEKSLAPKEETIIEVELTVLQKQYYRAIYEKNTEFLSRGGKKGNTPSLMNVLMELRKCCNHPFLVKGVEEREAKRLASQKSVPKEEIQRQISESLVDSSGKLVLLNKLLPRLKESGHRVLIFSQFRIMLDIIQDYLALRRYNCERIDGNITGNERQTAIDRFCREDSDAFIMLLSTRAGGVGINLTAADTVIIYDSDWNPQNDLQAQARCHRIGQKKSVKIYRLLTSKTYELHMFHKASLKLGLDQAVLGGIKNDDPVAKLKGASSKSKANDRMSKEEIESLLKHGAYEMFKEQDGEAEAASKKFGEESIDQILSRSTTIVHDPTRNVDGNEKRNIMSSFSKATFVSSTDPDDKVDVDDPNFWTKVIGLKGVEEQKMEEPSPLQTRRCRRKVKSYLTDDDKSFMVGDSGDDNPSLRKRPYRELGVVKDEEFVVSDDDDDDDDLSDEDMAKDGLSGVTPVEKRKRSKAPLLPIYSHIERIAELLGSLGYGRWDDMKRHAPILQAYPDQELSKCVQEYVCSLVRITTAMTTFPRIGLDLESSRVYIVSTTPPPLQMGNASPIERYTCEVGSTCCRYRFIPAMLKDMRIMNPLAVAIPPRMWITDFKSRAARGSRTKLQQIDTMYKLNDFVGVRLVPPGPLIALITDFQCMRDKAAVHRMIESGIVPENGDTSPVDKDEKLEPVLDKPADPAVDHPSAESLSARSGGSECVSKNEDVSMGDEPQSASHNQRRVLPAAFAKSDVEADPTGNCSAAEHFVQASSENTSLEKCEPKDVSASSLTVEEATSTVYIDTATTKVSNATNNEDISTVAKSQTPSAQSSGDTTDSGANGQITLPESVKNENLDPPAHSNAIGSSTTSAAAIPTVQQRCPAAAIVTPERNQAMRILQTLLPVNSSEPVAPWWIPRVDDVLLMMYVHREGWIKGRALPLRMVKESPLFGDRAKRHPLTEWPSVASLNRRVKVLLHAWTVVRIAQPVVPSAPSIAAPLNVAFTRQPQMQPIPHEQLQLQLQRKRQYEIQRAQLTSRYPSASFHDSRHNRFAKLIFSYGIPDVGTCRDDRERHEKWRYFLQDCQLGVAHSPLEELLAEALDLERVCYHRLREDTGEANNMTLSQENSILGGKRGFWLLTATQCRRLLHRVDLFRLLRTQILVLPPAQLVEVVSRVVRAQSASTDYPVWWSCPRHDILLLQGVECYGLDEHLASVWKLPLFSSANTTSAFPSSSWVENYVTVLALACRNLIVKAQSFYSDDRYVQPGNRASVEKYVAPTKADLEAETRRRVRDICGMREEDPYFVSVVRLRQHIDSNAAREKRLSRRVEDDPLEKHAIQNNEDQIPSAAAEEGELMRQEDPYESVRIRTIWAAETKRDEIAAAKKRLECSGDNSKTTCVQDGDGSTNATGSGSEKEEGAQPPSGFSKTHLGEDVDSCDGEQGTKCVQPLPSLRNSLGQDSLAAAVAVANVKEAMPTPHTKSEVSYGAAHSWDVIVIDSSDDSN
ncbi:unnamed protein product [Hyaloperonospora brassicae]|uniref:Chromodomain-helicase-DNA-binding protein 6 n=1 Tax=Hyaloperonospora brassicae TaxID=162125 RepID=A0AAV0U0S6_HYABA|nr:unnamed protein product [Hyaloperonospora brassicae]